MNFGVLEKSIRSLEKSWKSPGKLFLKKGTNPEGIKNQNSVLNRVGKSEIFVLNRVRV